MMAASKVAAMAAAIFTAGAITGGLVSSRLGLGQARTAAPAPSHERGPAPSSTPSAIPSEASNTRPEAPPLPEARRKERPGPRPPGNQRMEILRHLEESIPLDPAQRDRIRNLVRESEQRIEAEWEPVMPRIRAEMRDLRRRIEMELRPDQRARMDALLGARGNRRTEEATPPLR